MPIELRVDHRAQLMIAVAEGDISTEEFDEFLDATVNERTGSYRKLFDGRFASTKMSAEDVMIFGVRMKSRHAIDEKTGPLAVVMTPEYYDLVSRALGMLATAPRPMCIFEDVAAARRWLDSDGVRDWDR